MLWRCDVLIIKGDVLSMKNTSSIFFYKLMIALLYLKITGEKEIDLKRFEIQDIEDIFPVERIKELLNE